MRFSIAWVTSTGPVSCITLRAPGDADAVLRHAPQAAREAESVGAHLQAADLYGEAARHADRLAVPDRARLFDEYA
jgi:hypothetical protein